MSGRRELGATIAGCLGGAALTLIATTRTWVLVRIDRPSPLPPVTEELTGRDVAPWVFALAVTALAGGGALIAARRAGRIAVGIALVAIGALIASGAVPVLAGGNGVGLRQESAVVVWPLLAALGGGLIVAAGVFTGLRGRRWAALSGRYEPPAARQGSRSAATDAWDALDRGDDPTLDAPASPTSRSDTPRTST